MAYFPEGDHDARVTNASFNVSNGGNPGIKVRFEDYNGHWIDHVMWCTPARIEYTKADLEAMGVTLDRIGTYENFRDNIAGLLVGAECRIVIKMEEYKGKLRERVAFINPPNAKPGEDAIARIYGLLTGMLPSAVPAGNGYGGDAPTSDEWEDVPF